MLRRSLNGWGPGPGRHRGVLTGHAGSGVEGSSAGSIRPDSGWAALATRHHVRAGGWRRVRDRSAGSWSAQAACRSTRPGAAPHRPASAVPSQTPSSADRISEASAWDGVPEAPSKRVGAPWMRFQGVAYVTRPEEQTLGCSPTNSTALALRMSPRIGGKDSLHPGQMSFTAALKKIEYLRI